MLRPASNCRVASREWLSRWVSSLVSHTSMAWQPASAKCATSSAKLLGIVVASLRQGFMESRILARGAGIRCRRHDSFELRELVGQVRSQIDAIEKEQGEAGVGDVVASLGIALVEAP